MTDDGCRRYQEIRFSKDREDLIMLIREISDEYSERGFALTVRQMHYQFVARGLLPNTDRTYDRIQSAINDGRLAGLIPWTAFEDRGRTLMGHATYETPAQALREARLGYKRDLWVDQDWRPEVWVEKAALEGVVGQICSRLRVDFYATRGYDSTSQLWRAGRRMARRIRDGQRPIVFHLGDHDPSGLDMTRDVTEKLSMFAGSPVVVQRLALNMPQVEQYRPPENPAKLSDSRAGEYIARFGRSSWELDALDPQVIQDLIESAVSRLRDQAVWDRSLSEEVEDLRAMELAEEQFGGGVGGEDDDAGDD